MESSFLAPLCRLRIGIAFILKKGWERVNQIGAKPFLWNQERRLPTESNEEVSF